MATSAWRPLAVARGGSSTLGGSPEEHQRDHAKGRVPPQNGAMHCRSETPKTKRCAVGQIVTMRCRFAPGLVSSGELLHGYAHRFQVVTELVVEVAPHAVRVNRLATPDGPDAIAGVHGRHRPTADLDQESLALLPVPCFLRLLLVGFE